MVDDTVEIIILPDGKILVPRGNKYNNKIITQLVDQLCDTSTLGPFFSFSEDSCSVIKHKSPLCG